MFIQLRLRQAERRERGKLVQTGLFKRTSEAITALDAPAVEPAQTRRSRLLKDTSISANYPHSLKRRIKPTPAISAAGAAFHTISRD